jgi:hypothetical protein
MPRQSCALFGKVIEKRFRDKDRRLCNPELNRPIATAIDITEQLRVSAAGELCVEFTTQFRNQIYLLK